MPADISDSADVLRAAGLTVVEMPGWKTRAESDGDFLNLGIFLHHDGEGLGFNSDPSDDFNVPQYMSQNGVSGSQWWISRKGVWYCMANGRKWHAGVGDGWGKIPANSGNTYCAAIETDHTIGDPWEPAQVQSIMVGSRALAKHYGYDVDNYCCGHKEYAPGRKTDPENFDLNAWRAFMKSDDTIIVDPVSKDWWDEMSDSDKAAFKQEVIDAAFAAVYRINKQFVDPANAKPAGDMQHAFNVAANAAGHGFHVDGNNKA